MYVDDCVGGRGRVVGRGCAGGRRCGRGLSCDGPRCGGGAAGWPLLGPDDEDGVCNRENVLSLESKSRKKPESRNPDLGNLFSHRM